MIRVFNVQLECHPFITVGARDLSAEPFLFTDSFGNTVLERLSAAVDITSIAVECRRRYTNWHTIRVNAVLKWIKAHMERRKSPTGSNADQTHNVIVFPEGAIAASQLSGLIAFVNEMNGTFPDELTTVCCGSHSFRYDASELNHYPLHLRTSTRNPYGPDSAGRRETSPATTQRSKILQDISQLETLDTKQVVPVIHPDLSCSLFVKTKLSPFERTNRTQLSSASGTSTKTDSSARNGTSTKREEESVIRLGRQETSPNLKLLVCSEALQLPTIYDKVNLLCIIAHHRSPDDFNSVITQHTENGVPVILCNDGRYGSSGVYMKADNRAENWWMGSRHRASLQTGDGIVVFELDSNFTVPQTARSNPRFPNGIASIAAVVPQSTQATSSPAYVSRALKRLHCLLDDSLRQTVFTGIRYNQWAEQIDALLLSRQATPVQSQKLERLYQLCLAGNLSLEDTSSLCHDCVFE